MEDNAIVFKEPEKRKIWVTVVLNLFGPGLAMIYCGRLKQGILAEAALILFDLFIRILLGLIVNFIMIIVVLILSLAVIISFLMYTIKLTINTNRMKIPRLRRTWGLIFIVGILSILASNGISVLVKAYFIEAYKMPSSSMENTILAGDYVMVTKNTNFENIKIGDIIVFKYPGDPRQGYMHKGDIWIKRIIATGGQGVRIENKQVFVDGKPFDEPPTVLHISGRILPHYEDSYEWGPGNRDNMPEITVPEGKLFVLGDNRDNSSDSRFWGFVDMNDIIGKTRYIHFSWDSENNRIRWKRLGTRLDK